MRKTIVLAAMLLNGLVLAQTSTSYHLQEYTFNAGGAPSQAAELTSVNYRITLASIGDAVVATGAGSNSFQVDLGFDVAYSAPGEVTGLLLIDKQTLAWQPERSAGSYNLYRDDTSDGYGSCEEQNLLATTTTDSSVPSAGNAFHYLVTVTSRLSEEGTKGYQSDGITERLGSFGLPACP